MDWIPVATFIVGVATAIFTGWAVWQRWRFTPRPLWVEPRASNLSIGEGDVTLTVLIENRGDAAAHDVRWQVSDDSERLGWTPAKGGAAIVEKGEAAKVTVTVAAIGASAEFNEETGLYGGDFDYTLDGCEVSLEWRQHPNLGKVRRRTFTTIRPIGG